MQLQELEAAVGLEEMVSRRVVQRGGHFISTFSSLQHPAGAHLPVPGEDQPYCQELAVATGCHAAGRQAGYRAHFQLGTWSTLAELFRGAYG